MPAAPPAQRPTQPWPVRVTHWLNVLSLICLAGSGLQILVAFPNFGPRGDPAPWYPFPDRDPPEWLRLGGGLADARHIHFAIAWVMVINAAIYAIWLFTSGQFRERLFFPKRDFKEVLSSIRAYLHLHEAPITIGPYNGLQRLAYTGTLGLGCLAILSGLSLYKPVQLKLLCALFGGYDGAREIHFLTLLGLASFTAGHIVMVLLHPREIVLMTVGGTRQKGGES